MEHLSLLKPVGLRFHPEFNELVSWPVVLGVPAAYLLAMLALHAFMRTRPAFNPSFAMRVYNFTQVALCVYMTWGLLRHLLQAAAPLPSGMPNVFGINTPYTAEVEWLVLVHYLSKYLDFFDTIFMLLRKKDDQVSFLHLYHHSTISVIWGGLLTLGHGNGTVGYGAFINSFIHILMYSHYFITSFGLNNPLKRYLTQAQLLQFASCIAHALLVAFAGWETHVPLWLAYVQISYHITMLVLFTNFYRKSFQRPARAGAGGKAAARSQSASRTSSTKAKDE